MPQEMCLQLAQEALPAAMQYNAQGQHHLNAEPCVTCDEVLLGLLPSHLWNGGEFLFRKDS